MPKNKLKIELNNILNGDGAKKSLLYKIDDYFLTSLIVLNVISIILESDASIYNAYKPFFDWFDLISVSIFTIEFIARVYVADIHFVGLTSFKAKMKYILSPVGMIDFLSIAPFYLHLLLENVFDLRMLRILRLFRLFRVFKLAHYNNSLTLISRVIRNRKNELLITIFTAFILILISSNIMYHLENEERPEVFRNIFDALWWAVATLTTIGYGDIFPVTAMGKLTAAITAIFGIGLVAVPTGIISMGFIEELSKRNNKDCEEKIDEFKYCPHCGKKLKDD